MNKKDKPERERERESEKILLSVVIPAYNEEERIGKTLESVDDYLKKQSYNYEIIIVANNCTDNTAKVVLEYQKRVQRLKLLDIKIAKPGGAKGWAVKRGIEEAMGEYKLFMDADNATRIEEMDHFWSCFDKGYDVVIGSRHVRGSHIVIQQPWYRQLLGRSANLLIQMVLLPGIKDTQCGFKAFSSESADKIFEKMTIGGWGFDMEILALTRFYGFKIAEVPVSWYEAGKSRLRPAKAAKDTLWELFRIKKNILTGLYGTKKDNIAD